MEPVSTGIATLQLATELTKYLASVAPLAIVVVEVRNAELSHKHETEQQKMQQVIEDRRIASQEKMEASRQVFQRELATNNCQHQLELEQKRRETQLKIEYLRIADRGALEQKRRKTQLKIEALRAATQREIEASRQSFQKKVVKYQCQENRQLQEFIKFVDLAISQSNQDFQVLLFEWQKKLQQELAVYNHQTQLEIAVYQRETLRHIQTDEYRKLLGNWPLRLVPTQIIDSHLGEGAVPLRIIPALPEIDYDRFGKATADFPRLEKRLARGLKKFLDRYYPIESKDRPTELLDRAWQSKSFRGGASIKALFRMLKSEPTLILESEVEGDNLNLSVAYWTGGQEIYFYKTVAVDFPYRSILDWSARNRATEWKTNIRDRKLAEGLSIEQIEQLYGRENNPINLEIWEQEERDKQQEIEIQRQYAYHVKDGEMLCQFLTAVHCLLAGWFADCHYLIHDNIELQFPASLPKLIEDFSDLQIARDIVKWAVSEYRDLFKMLEVDRSHWIPDLMLQLAEGLTGLNDNSWARELVNDSMRYWLQLRGIDAGEDLLARVSSALVIEDMDYVEKLNQCLVSLGDESQLNVAEACYNRGMQWCDRQEYLAAIADFDRAIKINTNWVEAYYNRGLSCFKIEEYEAAIWDYTKVMQLQPTHAEAYKNRGNTYYKLGNYEAAIADYDKSIEQGFSSAEKDRTTALGMLAEVNRKKEEEEARRQREEEECRQQKQEVRRQREEKARLIQVFKFEVVTVDKEGKVTNRSRKKGRVLKENLGNNVMLEMVSIPGGRFIMGSPCREEEHKKTESPKHQVTVAPFFMGKYPITQAQWEAVIGDNPSEWKGANLPVETVNWHDAVGFCERLSQKTGKTYRLPSEAEWEYACRAGTTTPFHFGETITSQLANYDGNYCYGKQVNKGTYREKTTLVGSFGVANAFGLYDIHGNVWEWCADPWHKNYKGAPSDGRIWESSGDDKIRMLRGGSWYSSARNCRSAVRRRSYSDRRFKRFGLRVVCVYSEGGW